MSDMKVRISRILRERMKLNSALDTQITVHKASGLAQSTVQRILSMEQSASLDVIEKLSAAFGM